MEDQEYVVSFLPRSPALLFGRIQCKRGDDRMRVSSFDYAWKILVKGMRNNL